LYGTFYYAAEELLLIKLPTDLFTLAVVLPLLVGSMWLARRGKLLGLLCWPGLLLYLLYIYLAYAIGVPLSVLFILYILIVVLSAYTLIGLVASIDASLLQRRLGSAVPVRAAGTILFVLAVLFSIRNLSDIIAALASPSPEHDLVLQVWIADSVVVAPAWLVGGLLMWQRKPLGYVAGAGLLVVGCLLFAGAVVALAFPSLYTASPVDVHGIAFILVVGLRCFVPWVLFARGIASSGPGSALERRLHTGDDHLGRLEGGT
jgi:hypothetical protein